MDAREALRRYLEQRRDQGESELVLDSLSVDEALALLGVGRHQSRPTAGAAAMLNEREPAMPVTADWREAILAAGGDDPTVARARDTPPPPPEEPMVPARRATASDMADASPLGDVPAGLSVGGAARPIHDDPAFTLATLEDVAATIAQCTRCPLSATAKNPVPGAGHPHADFMIVGEAPGANEDEQGVPFVGQAGQLLTKIIAAIDLGRDDVFIANVLKHRPPGNRNPLPDEVSACSPYLVRQIELVRPKVILALGTFAAQTLLQTKLTIGKLRGQVHRYYGVPLVVTYHPAALLRNPAWKRPTWEDVQLARRILDSARPATGT